MRNVLKSITGKYIIFSVGLVLFWFLATLLLMYRLDYRDHLDEIHSRIDQNIIRANEIHYNMILLTNGSSGGYNPDLTDSTETGALRRKIIAEINLIENDPFIRENEKLSGKTRLIRERCNELGTIEDEFLKLLKEKGNLQFGLIHQINLTINATITARGVPTHIVDDFQNYLITNDPEILENMDLESGPGPHALKASVNRLMRIERRLGILEKRGITHELLFIDGQIARELFNLKNMYNQYSLEYTQSSFRSLFLILLLSGLGFLTLVFIYSSRILRSFDHIIPSLKNLSEGIIPEKIPENDEQETSQIIRYINRISYYLSARTSFIAAMASGNKPEAAPSFEEKDMLGSELNRLKKRFHIINDSLKILTEKDENNNWKIRGFEEINELFKSERHEIHELSYLIINKLVRHIGASYGSLFVINDNSENVFYESAGTFAWDRRKFPEMKILPGEGLTGTCAVEKQTIFLTDIPNDYIKITSGLGSGPPSSLILVPLVYRNICVGILEIASLKVIHAREIDFIEEISTDIAMAISAAKKDIKTGKLLERSEEQIEKILMLEKAFQEKQKESEKAILELQTKEKEATKILELFKNSLMLAEFSTNGRIVWVNREFSKILDVPAGKLIGKHHSEFSTGDRYSDEYKNFWNDLKSGKEKTLTEKLRPYSGKEIWLNQTFTPFRDDEGKVIRILDVAYDVTDIKKQKSSLTKQAEEIERKNMEISTLSEAVNQSILKCELSPEGVILNANDNYCRVTGFTRKELTGKNLRLFLREDEIESFNNITSFLKKGKAYSGVVRRTKPTGEEVWLMSDFYPAKDKTDNIYKVFFLAQDITEKKLRYQILDEANKEINRLNEILDQKKD